MCVGPSMTICIRIHASPVANTYPLIDTVLRSSTLCWQQTVVYKCIIAISIARNYEFMYYDKDRTHVIIHFYTTTNALWTWDKRSLTSSSSIFLSHSMQKRTISERFGAQSSNWEHVNVSGACYESTDMCEYVYPRLEHTERIERTVAIQEHDRTCCAYVLVYLV